MLLVQLEVPRAVVCTAVRRAAARGARVVLNTAPYAALPADVVALADPVVANEHEMAALAEAGAEPRSLLVTFGANGAAWDGRRARPTRWRRTRSSTPPAPATRSAARSRHPSPAGDGREAALEAALAAGAAAVRHRGAQPDPDL